MKKVVEFSPFLYTVFKKQFNTSELGIVWIVSRKNEKGNGNEEMNFYSEVSCTQKLFQVVIKTVNRLIAILCVKTPLNKQYKKWLFFYPPLMRGRTQSKLVMDRGTCELPHSFPKLIIFSVTLRFNKRT